MCSKSKLSEDLTSSFVDQNIKFNELPKKSPFQNKETHSKGLKISNNTTKQTEKSKYEDLLEIAVNDFSEDSKYDCTVNSQTLLKNYFSNYQETSLDTVSLKELNSVQQGYEKLPSEGEFNLLEFPLATTEKSFKSLLKQASFEVEILSNSPVSAGCNCSFFEECSKCSFKFQEAPKAVDLKEKTGTEINDTNSNNLYKRKSNFNHLNNASKSSKTAKKQQTSSIKQYFNVIKAPKPKHRFLNTQPDVNKTKKNLSTWEANKNEECPFIFNQLKNTSLNKNTEINQTDNMYSNSSIDEKIKPVYEPIPLNNNDNSVKLLTETSSHSEIVIEEQYSDKFVFPFYSNNEKNIFNTYSNSSTDGKTKPVYEPIPLNDNDNSVKILTETSSHSETIIEEQYSDKFVFPFYSNNEKNIFNMYSNSSTDGKPKPVYEPISLNNNDNSVKILTETSSHSETIIEEQYSDKFVFPFYSNNEKNIFNMYSNSSTDGKTKPVYEPISLNNNDNSVKILTETSHSETIIEEQYSDKFVFPFYSNNEKNIFEEELSTMTKAIQQQNILSQDKMTSFNPQYNHVLKTIPLTETDQIFQEELKRITENEHLIYNPLYDNFPQNTDKKFILNQIEKLLSKVLSDFVKKKSGPSFNIRSFKWNNCKFIDDRLNLNKREDARYIIVRYQSLKSQVKFNIIVYILGKCYSLIKTNCFCTKREIYYQIVNYVDCQEKINDAVNSVSCLLDVPPWELGVLASSKGLVYGDLEITLASGDKINFSNKGGTLIPQNPTQISTIKTNASFILVIEKDSVYQKLLDENFLNKLSGLFILITGKGYPDINTRLFLKILWMKSLKPAFILTDADPDGIDIMLTYRFGSLNSSHLSNYLALPNMRWLGILPSEIISLDIKGQPLSPRDQNKIKSILGRPYFLAGANPQIKKEIEKLQQKRIKAEIEGIMKTDSFLSDVYLPNKFFTQNFI